MVEIIHAHVVAVWRESRRLLSIGGREGMLVLTDRHLAFVHKTTAKVRWWKAIVERQMLTLMRSRSIMNRHDGYDEETLREDLKNERNISLAFDEIEKIRFDEKVWGSVLYLEYVRGGRREKFEFSVARDWVKYPLKEPTRFMRVDWRPLVDFVKERQTVVE